MQGAQGGGDAAANIGQARQPGAAPATATGGAGSSTDAKGTTADSPARNGDVDDEGFQQVRARGWRKGRTTRQGDVDGGDAQGNARAGDAGDDAGAGHVVGDGDDADEGEDDGPPSPGTLHRAWLDEVAVVRRLRQQGLATTHPAMRAACEARDAAEREWRSAKDPTPAAVKLARAQSKLDRAIELQSESWKALTDYEAAHAEKLAALRARLEEDRERVSLRRRQLEEVQAEVGAEGRVGRAWAEQGEAARQVHSTLCSTVAPTIAALVDQLDSATPAWTVLNGLLSTLSDSRVLLEKAFTPAPATQCFNLAKGDAAEGDSEGSVWSESHDPPGGGGGAGQGTEGGGVQTGSMHVSHAAGGAATQGDDGARDHCMGTGEWWDSGWAEGARWQECGHGKWTRAAWADAWEQEQGGAEPAAARRRLDPAPPSSTDAGTSTAIGNGGDGDAQQRKRLHNERVQRIVLAAIDAGVQPLSQSGEELSMLDPPALDAWVAEHLQGGTQCS